MTDNEAKPRKRLKNKHRYAPIVIQIDPRVVMEVKLLAFKENTTMKSVVEQALLTFMKYLLKGEAAERKEQELLKTKEELQKITSLLDEVKADRRAVKRRRGRHKKYGPRDMNYYKERYPGLSKRYYRQHIKSGQDSSRNSQPVSSDTKE